MQIAPQYGAVQLEDGSYWEICEADIHISRYWGIEDDIVITPNTSWLCPYDYYIKNKRTNTHARASLSVGPMVGSPHSHWIIGIDYFGGHVDLQNGTRWCVSQEDNYILREWSANDYIIFGHNDSWFSQYTHILINVNMDNSVRAMQY